MRAFINLIMAELDAALRQRWRKMLGSRQREQAIGTQARRLLSQNEPLDLRP